MTRNDVFVYISFSLALLLKIGVCYMKDHFVLNGPSKLLMGKQHCALYIFAISALFSKSHEKQLILFMKTQSHRALVLALNNCTVHFPSSFKDGG